VDDGRGVVELDAPEAIAAEAGAEAEAPSEQELAARVRLEELG